MDFLHSFKAKSFKFISLFLLGILIISFSVYAQTDNPYTQLWEDAKGINVLSDSHKLNETYRSSNYSRKSGQWWVGPFYMKEKNKNYLSRKELNKIVHPQQGTFTVQGPGVLLVYSQATGWDGGPKVIIREKETKEVFSPYKIRLYWNKNKNRWVKRYSHKNLHRPIQPKAIFKGPFDKIKEGEKKTFNVSVKSRSWNNFVGTGEEAYKSPQGIDFEIWYFPLKGGKVLSANPVTPKAEKPREGSKYAGYVMAIMGKKDGSLQCSETVYDKKGRNLKKGDKVYFNDILVTNDVMVKIILDSYEDDPLIMLKNNTKIRLEKKEGKPGGIIQSFGRIFFNSRGKDHRGFQIRVSNCAVGCEGTTFDVEYNKQMNTTTVNLYEGKLSVECPVGSSKPFFIEAKNQLKMKQNCNYTITGLNPSNNTPQLAGWPLTSDYDAPKKVASNAESPVAVPSSGVNNNNNWSTNTSSQSTTFFEDFSNGFTNFSVDDPKPSLENGKLMWKTANFRKTTFTWELPMENVAIEFDGYVVRNGFNVYLRNKKDIGYTLILGGWGNKKSGSQYGEKWANRKLVNGKVWNAKQWHHYKIVRKGDNLAAYCDGKLIFQRIIPKHFEGPAKLWFNSNNTPVGLDNVKVYSVQ